MDLRLVYKVVFSILCGLMNPNYVRGYTSLWTTVLNTTASSVSSTSTTPKTITTTTTHNSGSSTTSPLNTVNTVPPANNDYSTTMSVPSYVTTTISTSSLPVATSSAFNQSLACYECEETFDENWDPNTDCQVNPMKTGIRECFSNEIYCMVEKITVLEMTVSIKRKCSEDCWYGCRAKGFGVTQIMCTSCCQDRACNTGNNAPLSISNLSISKIVSIFCLLCSIQILNN